MKLVAGHITQRSTTFSAIATGMMPRAASIGGAITQEINIPRPIEIAIRGPTSIPEPKESRLTSRAPRPQLP